MLMFGNQMALFIFFGFEVGIRGIKAAGKGGISIRQKVAGNPPQSLKQVLPAVMWRRH